MARARVGVLVRRVDCRPVKTPTRNLVVFSVPAYVPPVTEQLQLGTPAYYRHRADVTEDVQMHVP